MKSNHTPLPWHREGNWIVSSGHLTIAESQIGDQTTEEVDIANADLIVQAVNNHQQLVDALQTFINIYPPNARNHPDITMAIAQAQAVLRSIDPIPAPPISGNLHQPLNS